MITFRGDTKHTIPFSFNREGVGVRLILCLLMLAVLTAGCSDSDDVVEQTILTGAAEEECVEEGRYITLEVNMPGNGTSRSAVNPDGGETGDGRDDGTYTLFNERHISDAIMLLYKSGAGINSNAATVEHVLEFKNFHLEGDIWKSDAVRTDEIIEKGENYHIIVIANVCGLVNLGFNPQGMKISELRDKIYGGGLSRNVLCRNADDTADEWHEHFVMTSCKDDCVTFPVDGGTQMNGGSKESGEGTKESPYIVGSISVERLAARLDLLPGAGITYNTTQGGYIYKVYEIDAMGNATDTEIANDRFVLQSIEIVNIPKYGSYLLRRTMKYEGDKFKPSEYFGKDDAGSSSTVWMIDPQTVAQREACDAYREDYAAFKTAFTTNYHNQSLTLNNSGASAEKTDVGEKKYILAAYLPENTFINHDADGVTYNLDYLRCYATKVRFKGKYYDHNNTATIGNDYTDPSSTWNGGTDKVYEYTIRHNDPAGEEKATQKMLYAIVRNNLYRIEIAKVVNTNLSSIIVGVWYFRSGSDGTYSLVNLRSINIGENVEEDTGGANDGSYPTDAPRRKTAPSETRNPETR